VKEGAWDVGFLAIDPARATDIEFTDAYVNIEGTYMVPKDSRLRESATSIAKESPSRWD
jgi:polar amino acid transport system substrate-binding protein